VTAEAAPAAITPRAAGFWSDLVAIASRALRQMRREPIGFLPAVFIPAFFYVVNLGALGHVAAEERLDYKAFLLPMAIVFAVTGVSRAPSLVTDIQSGYFDRLCLTPVRRLALLLGLMAADVAVVIALSIPVLILGFAVGVRFATGFGGVLVFIGLAALWGLAFTGFPYAVALKTGSPAAVNATYVVFFPFAFMTDAIIPKQYLTTWFSTVATYNPVTYLLGAERTVIIGGWQARPLLEGLVALCGLGLISMALALLALRGRIRRGA
jgi:ABC-2 type transport system permease protein